MEDGGQTNRGGLSMEREYLEGWRTDKWRRAYNGDKIVGGIEDRQIEESF